MRRFISVAVKVSQTFQILFLSEKLRRCPCLVDNTHYVLYIYFQLIRFGNGDDSNSFNIMIELFSSSHRERSMSSSIQNCCDILWIPFHSFCFCSGLLLFCSIAADIVNNLSQKIICKNDVVRFTSSVFLSRPFTVRVCINIRICVMRHHIDMLYVR